MITAPAITGTMIPATANDILCRLEKNGYINKEKKKNDKRKITITLTKMAEETLKKAPPLQQEHFIKKLEGLDNWEQLMLLSSQQRIAGMMAAEDNDARPILLSGDINKNNH